MIAQSPSAHSTKSPTFRAQIFLDLGEFFALFVEVEVAPENADFSCFLYFFGMAIENPPTLYYT